MIQLRTLLLLFNYCWHITRLLFVQNKDVSTDTKHYILPVIIHTYLLKNYWEFLLTQNNGSTLHINNNFVYESVIKLLLKSPWPVWTHIGRIVRVWLITIAQSAASRNPHHEYIDLGVGRFIYVCIIICQQVVSDISFFLLLCTICAFSQCQVKYLFFIKLLTMFLFCFENLAKCHVIKFSYFF